MKPALKPAISHFALRRGRKRSSKTDKSKDTEKEDDKDGLLKVEGGYQEADKDEEMTPNKPVPEDNEGEGATLAEAGSSSNGAGDKSKEGGGGTDDRRSRKPGGRECLHLLRRLDGHPLPAKHISQIWEYAARGKGDQLRVLWEGVGEVHDCIVDLFAGVGAIPEQVAGPLVVAKEQEEVKDDVRGTVANEEVEKVEGFKGMEVEEVKKGKRAKDVPMEAMKDVLIDESVNDMEGITTAPSLTPDGPPPPPLQGTGMMTGALADALVGQKVMSPPPSANLPPLTSSMEDNDGRSGGVGGVLGSLSP